MPISFQNRTITQVAIDQGGAGSTDLVAAPGAGLKIYVVTIVVSLAAAGTVRFTEGTGPTNLTGDVDLAVAGGYVTIGDGINPVLQTNTAGDKLSIVSTGGAANGWIRYFVAA